MQTMKKRIHILCALVLWGLSAFADDTALIRKQFVEYFAQQSVSKTAVKRNLENIQPDGSWTDINYESQQRGSWPTRDHLQRLHSMATAYVNAQSEFYQSAEMKGAILNGLNHWIEKDYQNPNWWHGRIGTPQDMATIFILLDDDLPEKMLKDAHPILKRSKMGMTGQNKVWCAGIAFMKALLNDDADMMTTAGDAIWSELCVTTDEGIQPDWSFHQHGPQQQFGNYGSAFGGSMVMWSSILRETEYALADEKLEILRNYLMEGPSWILWNGQLDLSGCGRQVDAGCQASKGRGVRRQLQRMALIEPEYREQYEQRLNIQPASLPQRHGGIEEQHSPGLRDSSEAGGKTINRQIGFKPFWRSEMAVQRRPDWYASVKMSSTRVIGAETCNSENMQGLHLGDGTLLLYQTGKEYEDIVPVWDWHRLPGTTCDQGVDELTPKGASAGFGGAEFSGVLGDGETGVAAMIYKRNNLIARKAWFFEKDAVICLGAGIDGQSEGTVLTSVQQSWLTGPVITSSGKMSSGTHKLKPRDWVHHAGSGYQLFDESTLHIETVKGNWNSSFPTRGDRPAKGDVFSLWIDHGKSPKGASYAYVVYPRSTPEAPAYDIKILSNTDAVQAIRAADDLKAVFYDAGKLALGKGRWLEVDEPCLLSITDGRLTVADPTHRLSALRIKLNGKTRTVELPSGPSAGKQVVVE